MSNRASKDEPLKPAQKVATIAYHFREIMKSLNLDLDDPSLSKTPDRVASMYVNELFRGLDDKNLPKISTFPNTEQYDQMVMVRDIVLNSTCEHHFVPFTGKCHIAYFPTDKVLGLSKFNRIVKHFAARPQIQEKLTHQISAYLREILATDDVAVIISAEHLCAKIRGVEDACSSTVTQALHGMFRTEATVRSELFASLNVR